MQHLILLLISINFIGFFGCKPNDRVNKANLLTISENCKNPIGFYNSRPTFSWKLPVNDLVKAQSAYTIVVASSPDLLPGYPDVWNSGKVVSDQSTFVSYQGNPINSRDKLYWQVQYWDQDNKISDWSDVANFEMGLLTNSDWIGNWIGITNETPKEKSRANTPLFIPQYLRKEFAIDNHIKKARLYITAKGLFEAFLNGEKVGSDLMVPGWTPYAKRIETLSYDVTNSITHGKNAIGITLAEGWYSGRIGYKRSQWTNTKPPKVLCQLEIEFSNGQKKVIFTDNTWKATQQGPVRASEIYDGELYDANMELPGWSDTSFNEDEKWKTVVSETLDKKVILQPKRHLPVRVIDTLSTQSILKSESGEVIFDIGQNLAGLASVQVPMLKGDTLVINFGEMLNKDGSLHRKSYRSAHSTDYYIAKEDGVINWQPQFTYHGFRYVQLSGFKKEMKPQKNWVNALVMHSDFKIKGSFSSSNPKLNQLQNNIEWGLRSNFFEVPTDCPQRNERLGFTGDAQVFSRAALYNAELQAFFMAWLQSMREEQYEDNIIPVVIPNIIGKYSESGWSDAAVIIPWEVYISTGNKNALSENYDMIKRWVAYHQSQSNNYISHMKSVGDWLQPYATGEDPRRGDTPQPLISTAYFAHAAWLTAQMAEVLGYHEDYNHYIELYKSISNAFEKQYFDEAGKLTTEKETQTGYLLALDFNLLSKNTKIKAAIHLKRLIHKADNHLRTGFLGTPLLAPVLSETNNTDLMYTLLLKESYPSWLFSVNQGATTMWERWDSYSLEKGFESESMNSFNHYAYGAVGQFLYERIAGIYPLKPGYKKVKIAPSIGGGLKWAKGEIESPYGTIRSEWILTDSKFELQVVIPPNTTADIILPVIRASDLLVNGYKDIESKDVILKSKKSDVIELEVKAGSYKFTINNI